MIARAFAVALGLGAFACGSGNGATGTPDAGDGVNDVKLACEQRATWTQRTTPVCLTCTSEAVSPPCSCDPARGACIDQNTAFSTEPTCTRAISDCVTACNDDCACVDACYAQAPACRAVASALTGCVAAQCDSQCK